jgi:hypothetical protein
LKVIVKVKVLIRGSNIKVKVTRSKNFHTHEKILSQGTLMWNIKTLVHTIQKL